MANKPTAQTFGNDVSLLWLLKDAKTVYRSVLAQAKADESGTGLSTTQSALATWDEIRRNIADQAETTTKTFEEFREEIAGEYATTSDVGDVREWVIANYVATPTLETLTQEINTLISTSEASFASFMRGQIARGWVNNPRYDPSDPDSKQLLYGIVISSQVSINAESTQTDDKGNVYYEIDLNANPSFGFYTSEGWQFWIGGEQAGWYDSKTDRLHTGSQEVEGDTIVGETDKWLITDSNGFGIKYIGE